MNNVCWKPSKNCQTVGELKRLLSDLPDNMQIKASNGKSLTVRYEKNRDRGNKWVSITCSGSSSW